MTITMTTIINTRIYLRASTKQQDASRAETQLDAFAKLHGLNVVQKYIENESGASLDRPKLFELIADSAKHDILLCESTDRLSRLTASKWAELKQIINAKGIRLVMADLPTSYMNLPTSHINHPACEIDATSSILSAINNMIIDIMAAMANKDYEQRKARAAQGREKAKRDGKMTGRKVNTDANDKAMKYLREGSNSWKDIAKLCDISRAQVGKLAKKVKEEAEG
jgi:DNA invertase Pin-like site-specific DNA recombinase